MEEILEKASKSPFAKRVKLESAIVLARTFMSPARVDELSAAGNFTLPGPGRDEILLELGGIAVAAGRIVSRGGKCFFRIRRMLDPEPEAGLELPMTEIPEGYWRADGGDAVGKGGAR